MKKILIALMLVFFVGCAGPMSKAEVSSLPPTPTKEEVIAQAKHQVEMNEAEAWWKNESQLFNVWLEMKIGEQIEVEVKEITVIFNYRLLFVWLEVKSKDNIINVYVMATEPNGAWQLSKIIIDEKLHESTERKTE